MSIYSKKISMNKATRFISYSFVCLIFKMRVHYSHPLFFSFLKSCVLLYMWYNMIYTFPLHCPHHKKQEVPIHACHQYHRTSL